MKFCTYHWDLLRDKITERGLGGLIAPDATIAVDQERDQLRRGGEHTPANYDPLMAAHWAVTNNAVDTLGRHNPGAVIYLLAPDGTPEDPIEPPDGVATDALTASRVRETAERVGTWPRCPVCYLGIAHELTCNDKRCKLPRIDGYVWMLDRAANDALAKAKQLRLVK